MKNIIITLIICSAIINNSCHILKRKVRENVNQNTQTNSTTTRNSTDKGTTTTTTTTTKDSIISGKDKEVININIKGKEEEIARQVEAKYALLLLKAANKTDSLVFENEALKMKENIRLLYVCFPRDTSISFSRSYGTVTFFLHNGIPSIELPPYPIITQTKEETKVIDEKDKSETVKKDTSSVTNIKTNIRVDEKRGIALWVYLVIGGLTLLVIIQTYLIFKQKRK